MAFFEASLFRLLGSVADMDSSLSNVEPEPGSCSVRRGTGIEGGVFDVAAVSFEWLVTGPRPVCVNGAEIAGLPARPVPLDELGAVLVAEECTQDVRDAAWTYLITRARTERGTWTVACVGLALPVLLPVAAALTKWFSGDKHDIHAEVLTGFLQWLNEVDLDRPAILARLRWAAFRCGYLALREALDAPLLTEELDELAARSARFRSAPPQRLGGHPEDLLMAAVRDGVITFEEAALIWDTRFGDVPIEDAGGPLGRDGWAIRKVRSRAEQRLISDLTGHEDNPAVSVPRVRQASLLIPAWLRCLPRLADAPVPRSDLASRGTQLPAEPRFHTRRIGSAALAQTGREVNSCD
ncbi:sigma-70 family RNA polymerase sigma factor [Amycolatopsis roodepoortensis]|uniref:sigma-70 family RNA polymerase sigma factor n=1 Tax=Amycolatopsis roodepoortensis TaxID=700274 RepID=UPI00214B4CBB|nr:sigma-70 family RNA polymerase sigma factor [Amycolatopsis roodepoortensis]UUV35966.1 sigma-70 family RNA polymerase sigma factor [Amycolatopsis roodepoortensis]